MPQSTERAKSFEGATANLSNQFHSLAEAVGTFFIPALTAVITPVSNLINWLSKIPTAPTLIGISFLTLAFIGLAGVLAGTIIPQITAGAIAIAGLMGAEITTTASTIGLSGAMGLLATGFMTAASGAWALAAGAWAALAPLLPLIIPVALAIAGLILLIQDLWTGFSGGDSIVMDALGNIWESIKGTINWFKSLYDSLGVFKIALGPIAAMIEGVRALFWVFQNWREIPGIISDALGAIPAYLSGLWDTFKDSGKFLINAFLEGMTFGILNTDRLSAIFGVIGKYLPHSDAEMGPLADLTGSGQKFIQTFGAGAESQQGYLSSIIGEGYSSCQRWRWNLPNQFYLHWGGWQNFLK